MTVSMANSTTTSLASSVATLDITTLRPASSTPGTTAAPSAAPTTSSAADTTSVSLTPKAITSETSPPSTSAPRVPTSISTKLEAVTPETPRTSTSTTAVPTSRSTRPEAVTPETPPTSTATTAVPTSRSTGLESVTPESPPTTLLGTSSASSTTETTSTPSPTTDTSTSAVPTTTPEPCPPGAAHLTSESVCVRMFNGTRQWISTKAVCRSETFNSNTFRMITFKTKEKYDEIVAYLTQKNATADGIWVGLTRKSGAWRWEDGTEAQYLPWDPTESNSTSEKCGVIYKPTHWTLHNNHCNRPWSAMCEVSAR
ncbi:cell wall protein DAN4-like [Haliotis rubra]|uniref:cell wall protein DAN4-like n=1 Tax=Haliotis rubra TaxID=36100 RepID=UPI001EE53834|nr:cell wall protein DAN4-like [Haliotis rubra]